MDKEEFDKLMKLVEKIVYETYPKKEDIDGFESIEYTKMRDEFRVKTFRSEVIKMNNMKEKNVIKERTLNNTSNKDLQKNINDFEIFGEDVWKLIAKVSSKSQNWFKSTKAMEIPNKGCLIQVSTYDNGQIAEALEFIPNVRIIENEINEKITRILK